jgi:hypothetical protein
MLIDQIRIDLKRLWLNDVVRKPCNFYIALEQLTSAAWIAEPAVCKPCLRGLPSLVGGLLAGVCACRPLLAPNVSSPERRDRFGLRDHLDGG